MTSYGEKKQPFQSENLGSSSNFFLITAYDLWNSQFFKSLKWKKYSYFTYKGIVMVIGYDNICFIFQELFGFKNLKFGS